MLLLSKNVTVIVNAVVFVFLIVFVIVVVIVIVIVFVFWQDHLLARWAYIWRRAFQ